MMTATATPNQDTTMRRSIAGRLLFWFLVIALIPCAILTAITARIAASALEKSVRDTLVQTAAGKAGELEAYAGERVRDGAALARGPTFVRAVSDLTRAAAAEDDPRGRLNAAAAAVTPYLTYVAKAFGYEQLLLIDTGGRILFSLDDSIPPGTLLTGGSLAASELAVGFDRAKTLLQSDLSGFQQYGPAGQPLTFGAWLIALSLLQLQTMRANIKLTFSNGWTLIWTPADQKVARLIFRKFPYEQAH